MRFGDSSPGHVDRPQLHLIRAEDLPDDDAAVLSPKMSLPRFYVGWFEPVILVGERDASGAEGHCAIAAGHGRQSIQ